MLPADNPQVCKTLRHKQGDQSLAWVLSHGTAKCRKTRWFSGLATLSPYKGHHSFQQGGSTTENLCFFGGDGKPCKLPPGTKGSLQLTSGTESCQLSECTQKHILPTTSAEPSALTSLSTMFRKQVCGNQRRQQEPTIQHRENQSWLHNSNSNNTQRPEAPEALDTQDKCSTTKLHLQAQDKKK